MLRGGPIRRDGFGGIELQPVAAAGGIWRSDEAGIGSGGERGAGFEPGFGVAGGLVQYGALQTSYNWDCCGFSVEYRKYELGSVRNENAYRFNFTLANIGTAGNLRRAERLF